MDSTTVASVANASAADLGTVQGAASLAVLKKSIDSQSSGALELIQALPQPALAQSGTLGTQVDTYA